MTPFASVNQTLDTSVVDVPKPFFAAVLCAVTTQQQIKIVKTIRVICA
jgi:hypothetical protein